MLPDNEHFNLTFMCFLHLFIDQWGGFACYDLLLLQMLERVRVTLLLLARILLILLFVA